MQYRSPHIEVYHRFQAFVIFTIIVCDFDTDRIIDELGSIVAEKKIIPGRTLVFFDEIQDCPRAIQSLKYFCENMPKLHLIAAGSLLGVSIRKEGVSFPVGKIDRMEMYPMSFEEFVMADGGRKYLNGIKSLTLIIRLYHALRQTLHSRLQSRIYNRRKLCFHPC